VLPGPPGFPQPAAQQFKELIPSLIDALKDADPEVRQNSAMALAALGQDALTPLKDALKDANKEKRAAAAYALGQMGNTGRDAMTDLLKLLKDDEPVVRRSVSQAISRILTAEGNMYGFGMARPAIAFPAPGSIAPPLPAPGPTPPPADRK
jgi:HEAT repeat protein